MRYSFTFSLFIGVLFVFAACEQAPLPVDPEPYAQLKTGNYWVYQHFTVQANGAVVAKSIYDSIWIEKDTIINDKTFQKVYTNQDFTFLAISENRIEDMNGGIIFNAVPVDEIVRRDTLINWSDNSLIAIINYAATNPDSVIFVPAGDFRTINFQGSFQLFAPYDTFGVYRSTNAYYAPGIGKIKDSWFDAFSPEIYERRLVRYHVQ